MKKNNLLMRIAIGICVIASVIALYDRFGDNNKSENLSLIVNITAAIGLFLMAFASFKKKKES